MPRYVVHTYGQGVEGVHQLGVSREVSGVMSNIDEALKEVWGEEYLEDLPVPLHAEEIAQSPEGVTLQILPQA